MVNKEKLNLFEENGMVNGDIQREGIHSTVPKGIRSLREAVYLGQSDKEGCRKSNRRA